MMNIRFLTIAETEVDEAVSWYQEQSEDESLSFLNELDRAVQVVTAYPLIAAQIEPDIRSFLFRRFPYSLIYGIDENAIVVIAVAHQSRDRVIGVTVSPFVKLPQRSTKGTKSASFVPFALLCGCSDTNRAFCAWFTRFKEREELILLPLAS